MEKNNKLKEVPIGAKIISVLYYIFSIIGLIGSIIIIVKVDIDILNRIIISLFLLSVAGLFFFIGKGLWKGDNWARIVATVISILTIIITVVIVIILSTLSKQLVNAQVNEEVVSANVSNILSIFDISKTIVNSIIIVLVNVVIAGYLTFNKKVKLTFRNKTNLN